MPFSSTLRAAAPVALAAAAAVAAPAVFASAVLRAQTGLSRAAARQMDETLRAVLEEHLPSDSTNVAVVGRGGKITVVAGRGEVDGRPVHERTPFDVGTLAEVFTATAVLRLCADGTLGIDDPITRHLVGPPERFEKLTIRALLGHVSGLPTIDLSGDDARSIDAFVVRATSFALVAPPGRLLRQNPLDYGLCAAVVERASGRPFEDYQQNAVFAPARLKDTACTGPSPRRWERLGRGDVRSSARDLHDWFRALFSGRILDAATLQMLVDPAPPYAAVLTAVAAPGGQRRSVRVRDARNRAVVLVHEVFDSVIVVLGDGSVDAEALLDALDSAAFDHVEGPGALERFAGRYRFGTHEELDVAMVGGRLLLRSIGQTTSARLRHGQPALPEWPMFYEEVDARLAVLTRPLFENDQESFARGFHTGAAPNAAETAMRLLASLAERHGKAGRPVVLGTAIDDGARSFLRVPFGDTDVTLAVLWHGRELDAVRLSEVEWPFEVELTQSGAGEFSAQSIDGKARLHVAFRGADGKQAFMLVFYDESKTGRRGLKARRVK